MEFGKANLYQRNEKVQKRIEAALEYLDKATDLIEKPVGNYKIAEGIEIRVQDYLTRDPETMNFETHYDFLDIHYMVNGAEIIRFGDKEGLEVVKPYNAEEDIVFYEAPEVISSVVLTNGHYIVLDPEDAHMAHGMIDSQPKQVKKIVVKIAIN